MAIDKLSIYNGALILLGQRVLSSETEDRPSRYSLDVVYDTAVDYCLEIVKPVFASKVIKLDSPSASSEHSLDYTHTLPSDYLTMVGVYSDSELDNLISRMVTSGSTISSDYDTLYVRYTSSSFGVEEWTASFGRVVMSYLARELAVKVTADAYSILDAKFTDRVKLCIELEGEKEPSTRSTQAIGTLSSYWLKIYNDALFIMGLPEITNGNDDSNRRVKLDRALASDLVEGLLEATGWQFGTTSTVIGADSGLEPDWGYSNVFNKPEDLLRIRGMFTDARMTNPLKRYTDEGVYWFADVDTVYVEYVSTGVVTNPAVWPVHFRKLVAARMAKDAALSLSGEGADVQRAEYEFKDRESESKSNDAMQSPPRVIASGSWSRSRRTHLVNRRDY